MFLLTIFKRVDLSIFIPTFFIFLLGLLILSSIDPDKVFLQAIFGFLGFFIFLVVSSLDYKIWSFFSIPIILFSIFLLLATLFFAQEIRGSARWLDFGLFLFQPSEFVKPFLVIFLASFFSQIKNLGIKEILISLIAVLVPAFLVFKQPDLGNTLLIFSLWVVLIFVRGLSFRYTTALILVFLILIPIFWGILAPYQKERINTFLNPQLDPLDRGYSILQAKIATGSGQFLGRGLGEGTQSQLLFLPARSTDFIFAAISEELGFLGVLLLLFFYLLIILKGIRLSLIAPDTFSSLLAFGLIFLFTIQLFVNISSNLNILPVTGVTLPLVSYGGSSLTSFFFLLGILSSFSFWMRKKAPI